MTKLSRIVTPALFAAMALGAAMPAHAYSTPHSGPRHHAAIERQIDQLQRAVSRNDGRDRISEREAAGLRREVTQLRQQYRVFSRNGLTRAESRTLERRIDAIRDRLQAERRDRDHRRW